MIRSQTTTAIAFLMITAILGVLMRYNFIGGLANLSYQNILQAHSHTAFLGWVYLAITGLNNRLFLSDNQHSKPFYRIHFIVVSVLVVAMMGSFSIQGYGLVSISLLIAFLICSYCYCYHFLKDLNSTPTRILLKMILKTAIGFYLVSSLVPWILGPVVVMGYGKTELYYNLVYMYLHFFYNGFFVFSIFALFIGTRPSPQRIRYNRVYQFFILTATACVPGYFLSTLWTNPDAWIYVIAGAGALIQFLALVMLWKTILPLDPGRIWYIIWGLFTMKTTLQLLSALPWFSDIAYQLKSFFVIGYLHLVLLGFVTIAVLALLHETGEIKLHKHPKKTGFIIFLIGFITTEILLFGQGILSKYLLMLIPGYYSLLFGSSLTMLIGIAILFFTQALKTVLPRQ